jgi:hypothetical protein
MTVTVRQQIVAQAAWFVAHKAQISYEEVRPFPLGNKLPMTNDCSATFTDLYYLAGAPDPNGPAYHYDGYGNTDSLAANGQAISQSQILPGDAVIYYDGDTTVHVACIITPSMNNAELVTMSHGWSGEPSYVTVAEDGRPHKFFRFAVNSRFPAPVLKPVLPAAKGTPTKAELEKASLVRVRALGQKQAVDNGWHLWYFSIDHFVVKVGDSGNAALYANVRFREKA